MVKRLTLVLSLFALFLSTNLFAQDIPERPNPPRLVNDFAGVLKPEEVNALEQKLVAFADSTTTQIAVVIVPSLNGYDKADFTDRLGEKWGVGTKKNNGVIVLVKPKTGQERGEARISIGYGLEGIIPDAIANRIVDNELIPAFRENDYYKGIDAGTNVLIKLANKEFTASEYAKKGGESMWVGLIPLVIILVVIFLMRGSSRRNTMGGSSLPFWATLFMLNSMGGRSHGSWNDFNSGGGMFGGGGGSGFGGFGGGSFGGGGAGGSW
jgi:uncharacterized protein